MSVIKRFGSGLFSAWPASHPKEKVSGVMALICLVGGRLFDHLYPSPPWAFHHLHLTNYSLRLKVGYMHMITHTRTNNHNSTTSAPHHFSFLTSHTALPAPNPLKPSCFSLTLLHLCSPVPALSFLRLSQIWRGNVWWMRHCSCPLLAWFQCHSPSSPSARLFVGLSYPFTGFWNPVELGGLKIYAIPHIVCIQTLVFILFLPYLKIRAKCLYF